MNITSCRSTLPQTVFMHSKSSSPQSCHGINTFSHPHRSLVTHTDPFTSNNNSKSSCAMPRTQHRAAHASQIRLTCLCLCNKRPLVCGLNQTEILREIVSCIDTLCGEAFVVHSLIDRTRLQHIKTSLANTNMILTSFRSHTCTCPWRMFIFEVVWFPHIQLVPRPRDLTVAVSPC